jgi:uncharacterized protein
LTDSAISHVPSRPEPSWQLTADDIVARNIRFGILDAPKRHWFDGSLHKTALLDALSVFLPEGERYFIRSLKHFAPMLNDKELAREIMGYSIQEAYHTREHEEYNRALESLGYDVEDMERPIKSALGMSVSPLFRLATTCAIEHITASTSANTLQYPEIFEGADPRYRRLWSWHALEELEHKAVAHDIFMHVTKDMSSWKRYMLRISAMNSTSLAFFAITIRNVRIYAKNDGAKTGVVFWWKMFSACFYKPGFLRLAAWELLRYYKPGFNPRAKTDRALMEKGRAWLALHMNATGSDNPAKST